MSSNVKFEHQAITATNEDTKTQTATSIDIKCGLQCILKCSSPEDVNNDQSILYGCLKSCLQECQQDDKPAIPVEMTTPKSVKFEHQAITATNEDTKTRAVCNVLQCILKCSSPEDVNNDQSILFNECLKRCLQECHLDDKPAIPVEMTTPKSAGTTVLLPLLLEDITIEEICSIPCNDEDHEVPELICSLCKDVSEFEKSLTIGNICEIDPCYFPKFCNFCKAINNAGLLDKKSEQQSLTITSNNNPKIGGGWIQGLKDHQSIIKKNF